MKITVLNRALKILSAGRTDNVAESRRQSLEYGIQPLNGLLRSANHHAITTFQAPDAATGAHVDIINLLLLQRAGPAHVVFKVGIATINNGVVRFEVFAEIRNSFFGRIAGWNHNPNDARPV